MTVLRSEAMARQAVALPREIYQRESAVKYFVPGRLKAELRAKSGQDGGAPPANGNLGQRRGEALFVAPSGLTFIGCNLTSRVRDSTPFLYTDMREKASVSE